MSRKSKSTASGHGLPTGIEKIKDKGFRKGSVAWGKNGKMYKLERKTKTGRYSWKLCRGRINPQTGVWERNPPGKRLSKGQKRRTRCSRKRAHNYSAPQAFPAPRLTGVPTPIDLGAFPAPKLTGAPTPINLGGPLTVQPSNQTLKALNDKKNDLRTRLSVHFKTVVGSGKIGSACVDAWGTLLRSTIKAINNATTLEQLKIIYDKYIKDKKELGDQWRCKQWFNYL